MSHSVNDLLSQSQSRNQQGSANNLVKASKSTKRRPIKKRKYSRGGCKECKRRRLKCDEGKPSCWNCAHLNKICVYEKKIKFVPSTGYVADQSTAALGKASNDEGVGCSRSFEPLPSFKSVSSTVSEPSSFEFRHQALPNLGYPSNVISSSTGTQFLGSSLNMGASSQQIGHNGGDIFRMPQSSHFIFATPSIPLAQKQQVNDNLFNGASNVISDLNDIIQHYNFEPASSQNVFYNTQSQQQPQLPQSSYLPIHNVPTSYALSNVGSTGNADVSSGTEPDSQNGTKKWLHTSNRSKSKRNGRKEGHQLKQQGLSAYPSPPIAITTSKSSHRFDYLYVLNHTISSSELLSLCEYFGWSANDSHINYIKIFVTKIQMKFIPFTTSFLNNAYIKCFLYEAKSSPHLLYAMLAISAKYELTKVSETKTGISDSQRIQTMEFHRKSRSDYLKMCTEALDLIMNSKTKTLENIESLLMTILVLGSDFSGVEGSQWRSHLKGAKNLLLQYCKFRPVSLELVIVWLWFCSMETLAGLTTFNGGTIHDFDEMQEFLEAVKSGNSSIGLALRKFGFLFGGYYVEEHGSAILKDKKSFITGERNPLRKVSRHHNKSGKNDSLDSGSNSDSSNGYNSSGSSDESMGQSKKAERHNEAANFIVVGGQRIRKVMNYNLYVGYNDDVMDVMNGIFIAIECIRKFKQGVENDNQIFEVLNRSGTLKNEQIVKLFAAISKARSFTVINNQVPYRIPLDSPYHPLNKKGYHYNNPTGVNVIISGYIHDTNPNTKSSKEADNWYSWLDLSQQLYVDACLLRLLTMEDGLSSNGLSIKNSMVQDVVNRMIESLGCLVSFAKSVGSEGMEALNCHFNEPSVVGKDSAGDDGVSRHGLSASMAKYGATADTLGMANDSSIEELTMFGPLTREKALNIQKEHELENSEKNARMRRGSSSSSSNGQIQFQDYLYYQLDSRLVMVQWPLFVCGLCCVNPKHKLIISCCFNTLMNLGVESSEMTFARVVRLWHRQREGLFDYEHQNVFEDSGDSVPFT